MKIKYRTGNDLDLDEVIDLYRDSTLGERRPVDNRQRMRLMLANANLVITAWHDNQLVGIARSMTDWVYATYLADLSVKLAYQRKGIGKQLIRRTQQACGPETSLILLSAPKATEYYPKIGMLLHRRHSGYRRDKDCRMMPKTVRTIMMRLRSAGDRRRDSE